MSDAFTGDEATLVIEILEIFDMLILSGPFWGVVEGGGLEPASGVLW